MLVVYLQELGWTYEQIRLQDTLSEYNLFVSKGLIVSYLSLSTAL